MSEIVGTAAFRGFQELKGIHARVTGRFISTYWWRGRMNFGDLLTRDILRTFGFLPIFRPLRKCDIIGVGSVLQSTPEAFSSIIAGAGMISATPRRFPNAKILGLRGRHTGEMLGVGEGVTFGDPGLLSRRLIDPSAQAKRYRLGIIPHYVDKADPRVSSWAQRFGDSVRIIDVEREPRAVLAEIAQCEAVISSSLHGCICADSFGIPNRWALLSSKVIGDGFKFHDYWSAFGIEREAYIPNGRESLHELITSTIPPGAQVEQAILEVESMFRSIAQANIRNSHRT